MNIDNQPVRVGQQERRILGDVIHFQHHPGRSLLVLRHPDLLQEAILHVEALAHQRRNQFRVRQVEEDAVRIGDAPSLVFHLRVQIDRHAGVVRRRPVPDARDLRRPSRLCRRSIRIRRRCGRNLCRRLDLLLRLWLS